MTLYEGPCSRCQRRDMQIYDLQEKLAEARKDGERMTWVQRNVTELGANQIAGEQTWDVYWDNDLGVGFNYESRCADNPLDLRAAIDAAMAEGEGKAT